MTTIVYNHIDKVICCDSRCIKGLTIMSDNAKKIRKVGPVTFIGAGSVSDIDILIKTYPYGYEGMDTLEACMFVVEDGKVFEAVICDGTYSVVELECSASLGSGGQFALAAMDFGCNAKAAVRYAMTRDIGTGGKIKTVVVK
jgi:ATP-dependent protease HslVU (ClpYQ) peptidase subunit